MLILLATPCKQSGAVARGLLLASKLVHLPRACADICTATVQGNALLVGVGGSGKQSLAKLAAFISGCEVFEITLTRGYDEAMFREDLKQLYSLLGSDNKKVLLLSANCPA